jgi:hypothetical protein
VSTTRQAPPAGTTRLCPHCRAVILDSASNCPACKRHLRFDKAVSSAQPTFTPLRVEGSIRHPEEAGAWEYSMLIAIRNERGEEIARQVIGVGALKRGEERTFSLSVDVFAREGSGQ